MIIFTIDPFVIGIGGLLQCGC